MTNMPLPRHEDFLQNDEMNKVNFIRSCYLCLVTEDLLFFLERLAAATESTYVSKEILLLIQHAAAPDAFYPLLSLFRPDHPLASEIMTTLAEILKCNEDRRPAFEFLCEDICQNQEPGGHIRGAVLFLAGYLGMDQIFPLTQQLVQNKRTDRDLKLLAIKGWAHFHDERSLRALVQVAKNYARDLPLALVAIESLGHQGDPSVIPILVKLWHQIARRKAAPIRYLSLQNEIIQALTHLPHPRTTKVLIHLLHSREAYDFQKEMALLALRSVGPAEQTYPLFLRILQNQRQPLILRIAAISGVITAQHQFQERLEMLRKDLYEADEENTIPPTAWPKGDEPSIKSLARARRRQERLITKQQDACQKRHKRLLQVFDQLRQTDCQPEIRQAAEKIFQQHSATAVPPST
jgi:hypothetical protein